MCSLIGVRFSMKKIKVVQIGTCHDHAGLVINTIKRLSDVFELVGFAVPEGENHRHTVAYEGVRQIPIDEALDICGLDAAIIETSERNLTKYALLAAQKGLAVHMDKPGGMEAEEFDKLISTVKNAGTVFHLGYMYRYNPAVIDLMKDIDNGKLGEIYSVEAHMSCMHTVEKRKWLKNFKGGHMFFLGCHLIDLIFRIMGEPEEIIPLNCSTGIDGVNVEDFGMVVLKYNNGISFAKTCAVEPSGFMRRQVVVCGSKGTVQLLPLEAYDGEEIFTVTRKAYGDIFNWKNNGTTDQTENFDRYETMMRMFAKYVNGEIQNPYSYDYELKLYKLLLKCCGM